MVQIKVIVLAVKQMEIIYIIQLRHNLVAIIVH